VSLMINSLINGTTGKNGERGLKRDWGQLLGEEFPALLQSLLNIGTGVNLANPLFTDNNCTEEVIGGVFACSEGVCPVQQGEAQDNTISAHISPDSLISPEDGKELGFFMTAVPADPDPDKLENNEGGGVELVPEPPNTGNLMVETKRGKINPGGKAGNDGSTARPGDKFEHVNNLLVPEGKIKKGSGFAPDGEGKLVSGEISLPQKSGPAWVRENVESEISTKANAPALLNDLSRDSDSLITEGVVREQRNKALVPGKDQGSDSDESMTAVVSLKAGDAPASEVIKHSIASEKWEIDVVSLNSLKKEQDGVFTPKAPHGKEDCQAKHDAGKNNFPQDRGQITAALAVDGITTEPHGERVSLDRLPAKIRTILNSGETWAQPKTVELKLEPESLGSLKVTVNWVKGQISAQFFAQNERAAAVLTKELAFLKENLIQMQINVTGLSVVVAGQPAQHSSGFRGSVLKRERGRLEREQSFYGAGRLSAPAKGNKISVNYLI